MGSLWHKIFSKVWDGVVPKPTAIDETLGRVLRADGTWGDGAGVNGDGDFVEKIRNIGFRLLDEPSDVKVNYEGAGTPLPWESGIDYGFLQTGYSWKSASEEAEYNNFVSDYSPVIYTNRYNYMYSVYDQGVIHCDRFPNSIFLLRGNSHQFYRFGFSDFTVSCNINYCIVRLDSGRLRTDMGFVNNPYTLPTINSGSTHTLDDLLMLAFWKTPFPDFFYSRNGECGGWYSKIEHVFLVDNLDTLTNPEEYHNTVIDSKVKLKWTDPLNIATDEPCPATWSGTVVVRKTGAPPKHRWDGTLLVNSTTRDAYKNTDLEDGNIESDKTYFYGIFPYDTNGYCRFSKTIKVHTTSSQE